MASSYAYTFHYQSGQRATKSMISADIRPKDLLKFAYDLAKSKKRTIYIRSHTYKWYNDHVIDCGSVEPNGEYFILPVQATTYMQGKL